ncbi:MULTISPECIES: S-layer homology domain-containing protein [unclassified Sporosarcina]|uniref:S-layer homology domain-containing protein n=1 Tax=unclassified Sporosarcina TaxID=2647733 RepID=UPI00203B9CB8|nr:MULTISPECIES: S-layer homology domain-containing protein [unclassified Sporosarcina]GKV65556.1 hypothetical protein NCCP2331_17090 [Sporosarcina sp. NCCP-2331]GLB55681.1 hypothetical protein NCCP2378_14680 [Sporosarcina sp. NCCP-2378]
MKKLFAVVGAFLLACSLPLSGAAAGKQVFSDVPPSKHFAEAVNELAARNIIGGYPDGTFKPGNSITRGQAAAIIAKMRGLDTSTVKGQKFKDVPTSHGFYKAIGKMVEEGIISGYPDGSFKPNEPIKRKNMAAILVKAFDLPRDVNVKNPFKGEIGITNDVLVIYKLGITSGTSPTTFSPNVSITRGQAAQMLAATEQVMMKNTVTVEAGDLGWDTIKSFVTDQVNPGVFRAVKVKGKKNGKQDQIQLFPIKEGKGGMVIGGIKAENEWKSQKYYVHVKKEGSELRLTLEKTDESLPTLTSLNTKYKKVQNIALAKTDEEKISDNVKIEKTEYNFTYILIEKPGDYIATVRFENGEEVRYKVTAFEMEDSFLYGTSSVEIGAVAGPLDPVNPEKPLPGQLTTYLPEELKDSDYRIASVMLTMMAQKVTHYPADYLITDPIKDGPYGNKREIEFYDRQLGKYNEMAKQNILYLKWFTKEDSVVGEMLNRWLKGDFSRVAEDYLTLRRMTDDDYGNCADVCMDDFIKARTIRAEEYFLKTVSGAEAVKRFRVEWGTE